MADYSIFTNDEEIPGEGILLKKARAKSKGGALTDNVQSGQSVLPNARAALAQPMDYRQRAADLYLQGEDMYQKYLDKNEGAGENAMLNALAAQFAGEGFAPLQTQLLKKAAGAEDVMSKKAEFLMQQAKAYETLAATADSKERERAYRAQQDAILNEIRVMNAQTARMNANNSGANANKAPAGYQWASGPDGTPTLTFIPGGPADPTNKDRGNPTEDENKAMAWLFQADNAKRNIMNVLKKNSSVAEMPVRERVAGWVPLVGQDLANAIRPADRQQFMQAADSMAEALLRAATGAGVNKHEQEQKVRELIPQIGDKPETIQQKINSYDVYLTALTSRAGRALKRAGGAPSGGMPMANPGANNDPLGMR